MTADKPIPPTKFYKDVDPMAMDLIALFNGLNAETMRIMDIAVREGWSEEKTIEKISGIFE